MSERFATVRKGYDPLEVDAFVQNQAEAWRAELAKSKAAADEWRKRAEGAVARLGEIEQYAKSQARDYRERVAELESQVAALTWDRDEARMKLSDAQSELGGAQGGAQAIVEEARLEAARIVGEANAEVDRWFAAARRRIDMALTHAGVEEVLSGRGHTPRVVD
ncbi:MAG: DivIVA domain-containing protein [Acidimicrobiia bacterium]|nr:DivIVA domain-containing protein [Acidimicrobiia bacterium]MDH4308847.1 DivIVA domain-containing protein [Acidimicrobiia bacterium]